MAGRRSAAAGGQRGGSPGPLVGPPGPAAAGSSRATTVRYVALALGVLLAAGASLAAFLTEDPLYLRLAVLGVAWAFVIAFLAAGGRRADQVVAAGREQELRHAYDLELEREVAARREYELRLENQLRREAQESMRSEVEAMRRDLAALAQLRGELQGLTALRSDMAHDMDRMRTELTEALSGEMLVERIVMRTQSIRMPADRPSLDRRNAAALPGSTAWDDADDTADADDDTVEADAADAADATAEADDALAHDPRADRVPGQAPRLPDGPPSPPPGWAHAPRREEPRPVAPATHRDPEPLRPVRPVPVATVAADQLPVTRLDSQVDGSGPRRVTDVPAVPAGEPAAERGHRRAPEGEPAVPAAAVPVAYGATAHRATDERATDDRAKDDGVTDDGVRPYGEPLGEDAASAGHDRLERILAENGVSANDGRRRRRYRDDDDPGDDVLSRVLGR